MSLWLAKKQRSNEVVALQNALNVRLKPPKLLVLDGIFGPLTEGAVREFQKCEGLKADGVAGPRTLGELFVRRTMVLELVLSSDPLSPVEEKGGRSGDGQPKVGSPYDRPSFTPPDPALLSFEERWRAWRSAPTPKPKPPVTSTFMSPVMLAAPSASRAGGTQSAEPPPPRIPPGRSVRKVTLTHSRPRVYGPLAANEVLEFETATDVSALLKEQPFDFTVSQSFTAAMVKLKPYVVPSGSLYFGSGGSGLQLSLRLWDTPILPRVWEHMAGEANSTGRFSFGPSLVTSLKWDYLRKHTEFGVFGGLRIEGSWSKAWEGRSGRERSLTMFAGLAAHAVFLSEKGAKGWSRPDPHGAEINFQLGFRFGPWGKRH
jgi:peptidoglycan hydrolase-like protein with peptidoglycan-binding domain